MKALKMMAEQKRHNRAVEALLSGRGTVPLRRRMKLFRRGVGRGRKRGRSWYRCPLCLPPNARTAAEFLLGPGAVSSLQVSEDWGNGAGVRQVEPN